VGELFRLRGLWGTHRIVSARWIQDSIRPWSDLGGGRGYGYLWWSAKADAPGDALSVDAPITYASGAGGQYVIVIDALDLVVVHRAADVDNGISHERMGRILRALLLSMG
jgi:CubicO group peptidase (beta-lactamase class C family)